MRGHWGTAAVVGVGVVGCLIGGCSGPPDTGGGVQTSTTRASSPAPTVSPPATTTRSGTPTTTPTKIVLPAAATAHTEDGAKAFVAFFVEQMGLSAFRADPAGVAALSGPNCRGCKTLIDYADELKAKHQHVDHQSLRLRGQIVFPNSTPHRYIIDALIEDEPSKIVDLQNTTVSNQPGEKFTLRNTVSWSASGWVMSENLLVKN